MNPLLELEEKVNKFNAVNKAEYRPIEDRHYHLLKAPFGYPGGKYRSAKYVLPHLPQSEVFVEVFGGSGVTLLNKKPCTCEIFNDAYSGLIDFWKVLQAKPVELKLQIENMPYSRELWYDAEATWCTEEDPVIRAVKWYYMVQCSFGKFGKYFAKHVGRKSFNYHTCNLRHFATIAERIKGVMIENMHYRKLIKTYDTEDTVFYMDPPYLEDITYAGKYDHRMTVEDHEELLDIISKTKGFVALSHYPCKLYDDYPWDDVVEYDTHIALAMNDAAVNGMGKSTRHAESVDCGSRKECLYIKDFT